MSFLVIVQRAEERLSSARAQRNRLLAAFEGINAAEDDMEAVIARSPLIHSLILDSIRFDMFNVSGGSWDPACLCTQLVSLGTCVSAAVQCP